MATPPLPRNLIAFALGFLVVFLGASIGVQAEPVHGPVPMTTTPVVSEALAVDLWWLPQVETPQP